MTREQITYVKKVLVDLQDLTYASYAAGDEEGMDLVNKLACEIREFLKKKNGGPKQTPRATLKLVEE